MSDTNANEAATKSDCHGMCRILIALAIIFILAAGPLVLMTLNYNGYCFKEKRFISDQEKIRMVVERIVIKRGAPIPFWPKRYDKGNVVKNKNGETVWVVSKDGNVKPSDEPVEPIPYQSVDEFFARNPNCCTMVDHVSGSEGPFKPDFWDRATGECSGGIVRVTGTYRFRDAAGNEREVRHTHESLLSNCGRELHIP